MPHRYPKTITAGIGALLLSFAGGCGTRTSSEAVAEKPKESTDEYVYVQTTGSIIPKRIKKGSQPDLVTVENGDGPTMRQLERRQMEETRRMQISATGR